ncbi:TraK family protein [Maridesulfovibrio sp.]|uniref:TraK family protein n=1 Tax=Maridesulfovibrio sp. TaxID=2795000 RepID=UPI0029F5428F|nr:TraK family protein [Maridesulfovibrio sp.]
MAKKNKGFARVEFLANIKTIKELTQQGYTKKAIYEQLHGEGKVSMTYIHFCRFDPFTGQSLRSRNSSPAIPGTPAVRTASAPLVPLSGGGPNAGHPDNKAFVHENKVTKKVLNEKLIGK